MAIQCLQATGCKSLLWITGIKFELHEKKQSPLKEHMSLTLLRKFHFPMPHFHERSLEKSLRLGFNFQQLQSIYFFTSLVFLNCQYFALEKGIERLK